MTSLSTLGRLSALIWCRESRNAEFKGRLDLSPLWVYHTQTRDTRLGVASHHKSNHTRAIVEKADRSLSSSRSSTPMSNVWKSNSKGCTNTQQARRLCLKMTMMSRRRHHLRDSSLPDRSRPWGIKPSPRESCALASRHTMWEAEWRALVQPRPT